MSYKTFTTTIAETSDRHSILELRTRYYKTNYQKAKAVFLDYIKAMNAVVKEDDVNHKELLVQSNKYHIIVTFTQITPVETAVDFKVELYALVGLNRPKNKITKIYQYLDNNLPFKGVGLHP